MSLVRTRSRARLAVLSVAAVAALGCSALISVGTASAATGCKVTYTVASQWSGGFVADVGVTNLGDPVSSWTVTWSYGAGQTVTSGWNATVTQSGSAVTAKDAGYNGSLATNGSTSFGFQGVSGSSNPVPTAFGLNGTSCTGSSSGGGGSTTTSTSSTTSASTTTTTTARATTTTTTTTTSSGGSLPGWPSAQGSQAVATTIAVSGSYDGGMKRFYGTGALGTSGQSESQGPLFDLSDGETLQNVILGNPAADGVHCAGTCTLKNVWWEDVGEDAATLKGSSSSQTMTIDGGGAMHASDKVFQHNGPGTFIIKNFQVSDYGKLYRSCGNCSTMYKRAVIIQNVVATQPGKTLAGINTNYGDTATLSGITIVNDSGRKNTICDWYLGNSTGAEPTQLGSGPSSSCRYSSSDLTYK